MILIKGGTVLNEDCSVLADVLVEDGLIKLVRLQIVVRF